MAASVVLREDMRPDEPTNALMSVEQALSYGKLLASSGYFQDAREAAQAAVKVLAGAEMGIAPFQAMTGINIIKGKPALGSALMAALLKKSGKYDYRIVELTDARCTIRFFQRVGSDWEPVGDSCMTIADARKLANNPDMYAKVPRNMLYARAMSNGARWYAPDIFGGAVYTPEDFPDAPKGDAQPAPTEATGDVEQALPPPVSADTRSVRLVANKRLHAVLHDAGVDTGDRPYVHWLVAGAIGVEVPAKLTSLAPDQIAEAARVLSETPPIDWQAMRQQYDASREATPVDDEPAAAAPSGDPFDD